MQVWQFLSLRTLERKVAAKKVLFSKREDGLLQTGLIRFESFTNEGGVDVFGGE